MKRQLVAACALALLVCASAPTWASNGNIGMFFDVDASLCKADIPCGNNATLYVFALLEGASQFGITGSEYKVMIGPNNNADPGWLFLENFDPTLAIVGSGAFTPMDNQPRGVNAAWPTCHIGDGYKVLIETVLVMNIGDCSGTELRLRVVKHDVPANNLFQCPSFFLCDDPVYTQVCLGSNQVLCQNPWPPYPMNATCSTSGEAFINSQRDCRVAVQQKSWSSVKELYRQ